MNIPYAITDSIDDHNEDKDGGHINIPLNHAAGGVVGGPPDAMVHVHLPPLVDVVVEGAIEEEQGQEAK